MRRHTRLIALISAFHTLPLAVAASQDVKSELASSIDAKRASYTAISDQIWSFAELGYQEHKSSPPLQRELADAGFGVQAGVAGIPTAFVATYGSGKPVIGVLAEFDALPGLSQGAVPERRPIVEHAPGHACGHHLFGTASLANKSGKFRFRGISAHAAGSPWSGRSALDGVEAMNHMVNLMREHIPDGTRIHYVITNGGAAPNVVPDFSEVYYYVRHKDAKVVLELWERIQKAADGAALGTGTKVELEVINGVYALLPNETLARAVDANLRRVGGITYTSAERAFAEKIGATLTGGARDPAEAERVKPFAQSDAGGSTDVGDVSWVVPNSGFNTATWVPGTPAHSWQAVAAGGMSIGHKGMINAAKTMGMTVYDLLTTPALVSSARSEFDRRRGASFVYRPLIGDRKPPLDYRVNPK